MTETAPPDASPAAPEAVIRKRRGFQTVWIIPIVAALAGGWLWYRAVQAKGPTIEITFETADGLEAEKTKLKYKDLEVGHVTTIKLDPGLGYVIATVELVRGADVYLVEGTRFWVVKPRIGAGGISGLGTLVSGAYITADLSTSGSPTTRFTGLEEPPIRPAVAEGLRIKLRAAALGSISIGTPVGHLQIPMGDVEGYRLLRDEKLIEFDVFIEPEYADLVRKNSRFWNTSGINVTLSADGFDIHAESLESILMGGIAFDESPGEPALPAATDGDVFVLLPTEELAREINTNPRRSIAYFDESVSGVSVGTSVLFQGIEVGRVLEVGVEADSRDLSFRMPVIFETYPQRLTILNEDPDETHGERVRRLVDHGMRVQLAPANLLTGARNLMLDFRPESPMVFRGGATDLPEMPTVPSTGEAIADVLGQLPEIVADLRDTVHGVSEIINATGTAETLSSLRSSAASLDQLLATLGTESGPLLSSLDDVLTDMRALVTGIDVVVSDVQAGTPELMGTLQETFDAALGLVQSSDRGVSTVVSGMPAIQQELTSALHEIASGMRSLAGLAEFLERHPEALLRGKTDTGGL